ncbi:hypothetical protein KZX45_10235, partial [Georgenia sp. EYE_87]|uniref:hypothetical protein n=1 Tax=Georgenia sp. EYE_87 TaxID=2853448 RepID=UPI00249EDC13
MDAGEVRGGGGWCCPEDGWRGPCAHLLALASAVGAAERLARARELSSAGLRGLGVLLEAGDPWAQEVLEDLLGADGESPARPVAPVDVEGTAVLGGLVPAGFTRTSPLPAEEAVAGTGADADADAAGTDRASGADADADADVDADRLSDADADGDGEGFVDGGPAWSRALRRRVSEVFDPAVADNGAGSLGVGVGVLAGMRGGAD